MRCEYEGKIYVAHSFKWGGSTLVQIGSDTINVGGISRPVTRYLPHKYIHNIQLRNAKILTDKIIIGGKIL